MKKTGLIINTSRQRFCHEGFLDHSFFFLALYDLHRNYSQTGCSFDGNSAMLWCNVPILMGSLLDTTCNIQFKFA